MNFNSLPIHLFDLVLVAVIVFGFMRGRKHGMSEELLKLIKWLAVVFGCAMAYEPLGQYVAKTSPFSLLTSFLMAYIAVALVILGLFSLIGRALGGKILGSDLFGRAEYYLGMGSGVVRALCILIVGLAILNARLFTSEEVKARERYQNDVYGSNFFPGLESAQSEVFKRSLTGSWIHEHLNFFLIKPTRPEHKEIHQREYSVP